MATRVTPDDRVTQALAAAVMNHDFKPGVCGGKPCAQRFGYTFEFVRR